MADQDGTSLPQRPSLLTRLVGSALGTGYAPIASGTVGSALAIAIYLIPGFQEPAVLLSLTVIFFFLGLRAAGRMEAFYGPDPSEVTIDEVVGQWIALLFLPSSLATVLAAFFLFRLFDIIKPPPALRFDRMPGGFGIMMDDVIAGIYANIVLQLVHALGLLPL